MSLERIQKRIVACKRCPRLLEHCKTVAVEKRAAYRDHKYWGKPVPSFGDPNARLVILGLAPAAHGGNRTGRMFTGDRSGDWLYRALHKAGFANQPTSVHASDGLQLRDCWISASAHCAPPDNKPSKDELANCAPYLDQELAAMPQAKVYLVLGGIALDTMWPRVGGGAARCTSATVGGGAARCTSATAGGGAARCTSATAGGGAARCTSATAGGGAKKPKFGHGNEAELPHGRTLLMSYHPSQQNTFTGRLTEPMFDRIFNRAREIISYSTSSPP